MHCDSVQRLIGVSGQPGLFTSKVVRSYATVYPGTDLSSAVDQSRRVEASAADVVADRG